MKFIVAVENKNYGIGIDNKMAWYVPEDLKFFRQKTLGKNVVFGNNTYRYLTKYQIQLDKRNVMVLSQNQKGKEYFDLDQIVKAIKNIEDNFDEEVWICGGKNTYEQLVFHPELEPYLKGGYVCKIDFKQQNVDTDVNLKEFLYLVSKKMKIEDVSILVDNEKYKVTVEEYRK